MKRLAPVAWLVVGVVVASAPRVGAEGNPAPQVPPGSTSKPVKLVGLDLAVPDSPAFTILGLSPETVVRPGTPRDLGTTILNGVDRRGNLQTGLAVDFAPLFLFAGRKITHHDYTTKTATRLFARTQLSIATAKGTSDPDKSQRLAFGVRATLWDPADPRGDAKLIECMDKIVTPPPQIVVATTPEAVAAWEAQQTAARKPKIAECHQQFRARNWNSSSFAVGVAPSWQSPTGESRDFQYAGAAAWASVALALTRTERVEAPGGGMIDMPRPFGQFVVQGRYRNRELIPGKAGAYLQDSAAIGWRLLFGASDFAFVTEGELARLAPKGQDAKASGKLSVGGQFKLATGVWASAAVGANIGGPTTERRSMFVLSSLKWALSREPGLKF
jgi:hypothetical protein